MRDKGRGGSLLVSSWTMSEVIDGISADGLAVIVALVAVVVAVWGVRTSLYIRRREFEDEYTQMYWSIVQRLPTSLRLQMIEEPRRAFRDTELEEEEKKVLWDYLMLSEDEIDLRAQGDVTDETWKIWSEAIASNVRMTPYRPMFLYIEKLFDDEGVPPEQRPFQNLRAIERQVQEIEAGKREPKGEGEPLIEDPWMSGWLTHGPIVKWLRGFLNWLTGRRSASPLHLFK